MSKYTEAMNKSKTIRATYIVEHDKESGITTWTYIPEEKKEKEMKETNLQHYKEQLKTILNEHYEEPKEIIKGIKGYIGETITYDFQSCTDAILNWMAQPYKEPILDEVEREYLSAVIKPFRHRVERIAKCTNGGMYQIVVYFKDKRLFVLPAFSKEASMYKGMETFKSYSLKKLGL